MLKRLVVASVMVMMGATAALADSMAVPVAVPVPAVGDSWSPTPLAGAQKSQDELTAATDAAALQGELLNLDAMQHWGGVSADMVRYRALVIHTKEEWNGLWRKIKQPAPMKVLPNGTMAIALFAGNKPTPGYSIRIAEMRFHKEEESLLVSVIENKPAHAIANAPVLLPDGSQPSPWVVYLVPATNGSVRFFR